MRSNNDGPVADQGDNSSTSPARKGNGAAAPAILYGERHEVFYVRLQCARPKPRQGDAPRSPQGFSWEVSIRNANPGEDVTDLLTPEEVQKILKDVQKEFAGELIVILDRDAFEGLCRDYLTLWDRNRELEKALGRALDLAGAPK